jgi:DNA-binding beta-propeller fold protein YncE
MKSKLLFALIAFFAVTSWAENTAYSLTQTTNGTVVIRFTNNYPNPKGVGTLEGRLGRKWVPLDNFYITQRIDSVELPLPTGYSDYRLRAMSVVPGNAFPRLALAYGNIQTVGGSGPSPIGTNLWLPEYEGAYATNVVFSNPRAAVADDQGRIYVVERDSHAVSVIETNGTVRTAVGLAGARSAGFLEIETNTEFPATVFPLLNSPSGLYFQNGIIYILDAGNGRVLRYRNGNVSKLFSSSPVFGETRVITNGGALWVAPDEQEAFFTDGTVLKDWDASQLENGFGGVTIQASGFVELSDVKVNPQNGDAIVADRGDNRVYRVRSTGVFRDDILVGTGLTRGRKVGPAEQQSVYGPSSIAYLPIGGYLLAMNEGARVTYVDIENEAATLIFGKPGVHAGDGRWFRRGGVKPKISNVQSISVAPNGDIILLEGGYVRKIEFLRSRP